MGNREARDICLVAESGVSFVEIVWVVKFSVDSFHALNILSL